MHPPERDRPIHHALHPSTDDLAAEAAFQRHYLTRVNLYEQRLAVPVGLLAGQHVLDVRCRTGENALVFALLGADVTLVDDDPTMEPDIDARFRAFGATTKIRRKVFRPFQSFEDEPIFALASAEGFLFALPNRDDVLRKMISVLRPGGIAVVSFPDRFGSFIEFLKKAVMWRLYQLHGLKDDAIAGGAALQIARSLFEPAFLALKSSRDFRTWWLDSLVSTALTWEDCWAHDEIVDIAWNVGAGFHASTPRIYELPALSWYKAPWAPDQHRDLVLRSYRARRFDLLFGRAADINPDNEGAIEATVGVERILRSFTRYFGGLEEPLPELDFAPVAAALVRAGARDPLLQDFTRFFELLRTEVDPAELTRRYLALPELPASWGSSYQHVALVRSAAPGISV